MAKRRIRPPGGTGRPWTKDKTRPTCAIADPDRWVVEELAALEAAARAGDAVALAEAIRRSTDRQLPAPVWTVGALEAWLAEFLNLARRRPTARFTAQVRGWPRQFLDRVIALHVTDNREVYGLTWAEACDEAHDHFAGTAAAGSASAMKAACKRDASRRRSAAGGRRRAFTRVELRLRDTLRNPRSAWWTVNADRHSRGLPITWRPRPRRLRADVI